MVNEDSYDSCTQATPEVRSAIGATSEPTKRFSTVACPEHGDDCAGATCCCIDKHPEPASDDDLPPFTSLIGSDPGCAAKYDAGDVRERLGVLIEKQAPFLQRTSLGLVCDAILREFSVVPKNGEGR